ncbi:hypothetical protein RvY_01272 [Ramazzottius varieornatus]|uniref:ER membrane protein complex subunit 7 beta-sandwich domain-containing protein n=1 Tax=Ramazzottius varieornatus TaxID=947166 RepID=A0A1D1ULT5_RAMVA|nr:hypothetical protein RvY_01272 [Ramazzottius varieornatus]
MHSQLDRVSAFVAVLAYIVSGYPSAAQDSDTVICGGFVQSEYSLDYSKIEVHLLDKHGNLKYQTGCSANNGNYEVPIFDKRGDFILTVHAPSGISFEPDQLMLHVDGKNDPCSKQENLNFRFAGFSCSGRIQSAGSAEGPAGVAIKLSDSKGKEVASTMSEGGGRFQIKRLLPGTYTLEATHSQFQLVQPKLSVVVAQENVELPDQSLVVNGYSLTGNVKSSGEPISGVSFLLYSKTAKPSDVRGCEKPELKENQAEVGNLQYGTLLCSVKSDSAGKFTFRSLASSRYTLVPEYAGGSTKYDIEPAFHEFTVNHEPVEIAKLFEVKGFTAYGSVLTSKNGQGIASADVYINNTLTTKTDKKGQFQLDKTITGWYKVEIQKEYYDFPTVYTKITPTEAVIPPVVARSMMVCGSVTTLRPLNRMVSFDAVDVKTGMSRDTVVRDGKFCILLEAGEHKVSIFDAPQNSKEQKLVFSPAEKLIQLKDFPITDLVFEQVLGTVSGQIRCINVCPKDLRVSILTGSGENFVKVEESLENKAVGFFKFSNVDLGMHVIKIVDSQSKRSCWDMVQKTIELTVTKPSVTVGFIQTGYVFEIWSSHDTMISYKLAGEGKSESPETATIKGKFTELCLPKPGQYTIEPRSCHKFEQDSYTFDTENPGKLSMQAVAHSTNISVNTDDDKMSFKLRIKKSSDGSSSILSPSGSPRQITPELFQYNFLEYFAANEDLTVYPSSETLLFKPIQAELSVTDNCEKNTLVLEAFKGVLITGSLVPPVADADVTVTTEDDVLRGKTDSSGNYSVGPVARSSLKDIAVEKRGYQIHRVKGTNNFKTVKLSEIRIQTLDANGAAIPGVLVSISSTAGVRTSNLTDASGTISFVSFAPGDYVVRPMVKEYKFEPSSKSITLTQGQTAEVSWNGIRIAYSALGKVSSLGGDPEVGLVMEAVSKPPCPQMQEECVTGNDGHFRISGLKAGCDYEVRTKSGELGRFDIQWISPANRTIKMGTDNVVGLSFLAFRGFNEAEFTGRIETTKEFLPTLKVCLYRADRPDEAQQCVSFTVNPMFYLNAVPLDNRAYFLRLESTLSKKDFIYSPSDVPITANVTFRHIVLPFSASRRQLEPEITPGTMWVLPLIFVAAALYFKRDTVSPTVLDIVQQLSGKIAGRNAGGKDRRKAASSTSTATTPSSNEASFDDYLSGGPTGGVKKRKTVAK